MSGSLSNPPHQCAYHQCSKLFFGILLKPEPALITADIAGVELRLLSSDQKMPERSQFSLLIHEQKTSVFHPHLSNRILRTFRKKTNTLAFPLSILRPITELGAGFGVSFSSGDRRDAAAVIMLSFSSTATA